MELTNRVAASDLVVLDLAALGDGRSVVELDLAPWLVRGLVLREAAFRETVEAHDWLPYAGQHVAVFCSTPAIVPTWAYLLVASRLDGHAASVAAGRAADLQRDLALRALDGVDWAQYAGKPVVVKGCGGAVPTAAYVAAMTKLVGVAKKVMYGEPCSSVPIWRRPKESAASTAPAPAGVKAKPQVPAGKPAGPPRPAARP